MRRTSSVEGEFRLSSEQGFTTRSVTIPFRTIARTCCGSPS